MWHGWWSWHASERPAVIQGPSNRVLSKMGMFHLMDYQRAVDEW